MVIINLAFQAIAAGDYILSVSSIEIAKLRDKDVVQILAQVIEDLVRGKYVTVLKVNLPNQRGTVIVEWYSSWTANWAICVPVFQVNNYHMQALLLTLLASYSWEIGSLTATLVHSIMQHVIFNISKL